jgi:hypothetical protein
MLRAAAALRDAEATLRRNAQEQRVASGDRISTSTSDSGAGSLYHRAQSTVAGVEHKGSSFLHGLEHDAKSGLHAVEHEASSVAKTVAHGASQGAHRVEQDVQQVGRDAADGAEAWAQDVQLGFHEVVGSEGFKDTLTAMRVVSAAAPLLVFLPGVGEAALVVAAVSSTAVLAMDAMQMANSGHWDAEELAGDGMSAVLSIAGAGMAGHLAKEGSELSLISKVDLNSIPVVERGVVALRSVQTVFDFDVHAYQAYGDVQSGDRVGALYQTVGAAAPVVGAASNPAALVGPQAPPMDAPEVVSHVLDTAATGDDVRHRLQGNDQ